REDGLVDYLLQRGLVELPRGDLLRLLGGLREEGVGFLLGRLSRLLHLGGDELLALPLRLGDGGCSVLLRAAELFFEGLPPLEQFPAGGLLCLLDLLEGLGIVGGHWWPAQIFE